MAAWHRWLRETPISLHCRNIAAVVCSKSVIWWLDRSYASPVASISRPHPTFYPWFCKHGWQYGTRNVSIHTLNSSIASRTVSTFFSISTPSVFCSPFKIPIHRGGKLSTHFVQSSLVSPHQGYSALLRAKWSIGLRMNTFPLHPSSNDPRKKWNGHFQSDSSHLL